MNEETVYELVVKESNKEIVRKIVEEYLFCNVSMMYEEEENRTGELLEEMVAANYKLVEYLSRIDMKPFEEFKITGKNMTQESGIMDMYDEAIEELTGMEKGSGNRILALETLTKAWRESEEVDYSDECRIVFISRTKEKSVWQELPSWTYGTSRKTLDRMYHLVCSETLTKKEYDELRSLYYNLVRTKWTEECRDIVRTIAEIVESYDEEMSNK